MTQFEQLSLSQTISKVDMLIDGGNGDLEDYTTFRNF